MYQISFILCYYTLLFIVAPLKHQQNFTSDDITIQYEPYIKLMKNVETEWQYNLHENITENDNEAEYELHDFAKEDHKSSDSARYEFRAMRNHEENHMVIEFDINVKGKSYFALYELQNINKENKNNTECVNSMCIQLCCPLGQRLIEEKCSEDGNYSFAINRYHEYNGMNNSLQIQKIKNKDPNQVFQLIVHDPCQESDHLLLNETNDLDNKYVLFANGSLYQSRQDKFMQSTSYCLAIVHQDKYDVIVCKQKNSVFPIILTIGIIVSLPFLLATFVVYSILPELQNMHGYTLRAHVSSLFVTYMVLAVYQQTTLPQLGYTICLILGIVNTNWNTNVYMTLYVYIHMHLLKLDMYSFLIIITS